MDNGKKIKTTHEHEFFVYNKGFKKLKDIDIEKDFLAVNGLNSYQDINWLKRKKQESIENGGGLSYIATEANCSTHTIRKWLKKYGLQFSKKEVASYTQVWNKGSPSIDQPMFGKKHSLKTRKLMQKSSRKGKDNNLYTGSERKWRMFVADECKKYKIELLEKQNYKCSLSGKPIKETTSEVDHIIPVSIRPDLAFDKNNLQILSKEEHLKKTNYEKKKYSETVKFAKIKSIKYIGEKQTYDLEVEKNHNYLGNGILVHNSQRYAEVKPEAIYREARLQDKKNRQNSINIDDEDLQKWWSDKQKDIWHEATSLYQAALDYGIAKEVARAVLPEGLTPSTLYVNGTIRSWIHYIDLRSANGTQKEHMEIARKCGKVISLVFPMIGGLNHVSTN